MCEHYPKTRNTPLERFRKHGKMGESFDRVANKVLDEAEANNSEVGQDVKTD